MTDQAAIHEAARKLIARYGQDAARQAEIRAEELRAAGDREAHAMWQDIHRAVVAVLKDPSSGSVH